MTMKEKLLAKREEIKMIKEVQIEYADGSIGATSIESIAMCFEKAKVQSGLEMIMVRLYAANYVCKVINDIKKNASWVFGLSKIRSVTISCINEALAFIGLSEVENNYSDNDYTLINFVNLTKVQNAVNSKRYNLMDTVTDLSGDVLGIGFAKVGTYYVPITQLPFNPMDCVLKNGGLSIGVEMHPTDVINETKFLDNVCSLKEAIEKTVADMVLDLN